MNIFLFIFSCIFVQNIVLIQFLGICPFLGVSKRTETAFGMGVAVMFVIILSSLATWFVQNFLIVPFGLEYLQTVVFVLVIASLVQLVEFFLKKCFPSLYASLGIYLPLITTNCAVLGVCLLSLQNDYNFGYSLLYSFSTALGFLLSIMLIAAVRERLNNSSVPRYLQGAPILLISAGLISIAFFAFVGF